MKPRLLTGLLVLLLSACTFGVPIGSRTGSNSTAPPPLPTLKKSASGNPSSYIVFGKRYYVLNSSKGFVQRGIASWYGDKFHGKKTSSGEIYNMHAMTAAHKTLPIPVYVRVKNLENGRSIVVKVNDRGPFVDGRIIDLSYAAAKKLGVDGPGTAEVEIHTVGPGQKTHRPVVRTIPLAENTVKDAALFIQMGSFGSEINATTLLRELHGANESAAGISQLETSQGTLYRVRVGPLFDVNEANAVKLRLNNKGYSTTRIVVQD